MNYFYHEESLLFHTGSLELANTEWEKDKSKSSACYILENVGMLARHGQLSAIPTLFARGDCQEIVEAAMEHLASLNLDKTPTTDFDETFDLALRVDALYTAWLVGRKYLEDNNWRFAKVSCCLARCMLEDVFKLLTEEPLESGFVSKGNRGISMEVIMKLPPMLFFETANGLWRAMYAERKRL
jgi:hypothetical protein